VRSFDRAASVDPFCLQAYIYRAGVKIILGDLDGALSDFRAISGIDAEYLTAYRDFLTPSADEHPCLIERTNEILKRAPDCAWAHVFHAFSVRSLLHYDDASACMTRAVEAEPGSAVLWALRARIKLTNGLSRYDGSKDMEKALSLAPNWGWLHCWMGEALRHEGDLPRALASLDRGLELDPHYRQGYAWRGGVLVSLREFKRAIGDLTRSLRADPFCIYEDAEDRPSQKSWSYNQRMLCHRGLGDAAAGLRDLNRAHAFNVRYSWVFNPKRDAGLYASAIAELDELLARDPRSVWALAWRGRTYSDWGRSTEALRDLDAAVRLSPRSAWPRAWRGKVLLDVGDPQGALAALNGAIKADPRYSPTWGWRARAHRRLGLYEPAEFDFDHAVRLDYRSSWALAGRGECRLRRGDRDGALRDLDRALAINPAYAEAYAWRAEVKKSLRDYAGALADAAAALGHKSGASDPATAPEGVLEKI
jgi:tetratricopeptide (TPR) repeat protein